MSRPSREDRRARRVRHSRLRRRFVPLIQALEGRQLLSAADFVGTDPTTEGAWRSAYGGDGYDIAQDTSAVNPDLPAYAQVSVTGDFPYVWGTNTGNPYALQNAAGNGDIASTWVSATSFNININLTDGQTHQVAIYATDWENIVGDYAPNTPTRSEEFDLSDAATGEPLDSETLSSFQGTYLVWNLQGDVTIQVTNLNPAMNAVVSGVFFGAASSSVNGSPFSGTPAAVPGVIQAEDFNNGGQGVAYNTTSTTNLGGAYRDTGVGIADCDDTGGGYYVGWLAPGDWLAYTVDVAAAGIYTLDARAASFYAGDSIDVDFNGDNVTGSVAIPNTGGWGNWQTVSTTVQLSAGVQVMQILIDSTSNSGINLNWVQLTAVPGPIITTPAAASPNPVTGTTTDLSVLGADASYPDSDLNYTWATTSAPTGAPPPSFSVNGTTGAQDTTVTFGQAGAYTFQVTVTDPDSVTATSNVTVTVAQTLTAIVVDPASVSLVDNATQSFAATANDQFGQPLATQPAFTWSVDSGGAGGAVNTSGLYTAPSSGTGSDTVQATSGGVSGTAAVTVSSPSYGTPFSGTPAAVPGVIQAEDFNNGGQGVAYNTTTTTNLGGAYRDTGVGIADCDDTGGGYYVGWLAPGDWLAYTVDVAAAGIYTLDARVASFYAGDSIDADFNGDNVTGSVAIPNTGGWGNWQTVSTTVQLSAGVQVMQILIDSSSNSGININWVQLTAVPGPIITTPAAASPNPVTGTTTDLSVLGADASYPDSDLNYTWSITSAPTGAPPPSFSVNGTTGAQDTTVTFGQAGAYTFQVTVTDPDSVTATNCVTVTVAQTLTTIAFDPASASLVDNATQSFAATANDQFGQPLATQPAFTWSVDSGGAGGAVNTSGLYTAPSSGMGSDTVQATSGGVSGTAAVTVSSPSYGTPFYGTPAAVPGLIQAEDFNNGGQGVAYNTTTTTNLGGAYRDTGVGIAASNDSGGGYYVGWLAPGDWLAYTVDVAAAGIYTLDARVASFYAGDSIDVDFNGDNVTGSVAIPNTGGWGNWQTVSTTVQLSAGVQVMQILIDSSSNSGFNLNWVQLTAVPGPIITTPAAASPNPVTGTTTDLSVLGADAIYADSDLTYTWATTSAPTGAPPPSFSASGTNGAQDTTVTFGQAGAYTFQVTVTDPDSVTATNCVTVTVAQTLTTIAFDPASASLVDNATQSFAATANDQFGQPLATQPAFTWSVDSGGAGGAVNTSGLYTAPSSGMGSDTVQATSGGVSGTAAVTVSSPSYGTPFYGTPAAVPGLIQAEDFNNGGQGVAYNTTTTTNLGGAYRDTGVGIAASNDSGGGYYVGWLAPGDWLAYTVDVAAAGIYTLDARVASFYAGDSIDVDFNGDNVTGSVAIPNTGGWGNWQTVSTTVQLSAGVQVMQILIDSSSNSGININWVQLTAVPGPIITTPAAASPNPVTGTTTDLSVLGADASYPDSDLNYTWSTTSVPAGATAPAFSVNGTNAAQDTTVTFSQAGTYIFRATVTDPDALTATNCVTVTVAQTLTAIVVDPASASLVDNATQSFAATANDQFGQPLATQPAFTWSVDSGGAGGTISTSGLYTAPSSGTGSDTVQAASGGVSGTATVDDQPPPTLAAVADQLAAIAGATFSGPAATFTDSNPADQASDFSAMIDWGDGNLTTGTVTYDDESEIAGAFDVSGTDTYENAGTYPVTVQVEYIPDGSSISISSTAYVSATATPASAAVQSFETTAGQIYEGALATFIDSGPNGEADDFTASIDWGDESAMIGEIVPDDLNGGFDVMGTHLYTVSGSYPITVEVNGISSGTSVTVTGTATVDDASLSAAGTSIEAMAGDDFNGVVAMLTDDNQYSSASDFTATIDWGDDSAPTDGEIITDDAGQFSVSGIHTYADNGTYPITVSFTDNEGGNQATANSTADVAASDDVADDDDESTTDVTPEPTVYVGHDAATVASFAAAGARSSSGSLLVSGLPANSLVVAATLYADDEQSTGTPNMTFAGSSLGNPTSSTAADATFYKWDVTDLVPGNGSYSAAVSGEFLGYGVTLVVVYTNPSLPFQRVMVDDVPEDLNPTAEDIRTTVEENYQDILGGSADLWIRTGGDNTAGPYPWGTNEQITLNDQVIGGPIDANLGSYASLLHLTNLNVTSGTDTLSITTPQDWFYWELTVLTTPTIDLSIDSTNTGPYQGPTYSPQEEAIKDDPTLPGKIIIDDNNDDNGDGIPDFANYNNPSPNEQFVPLVLTLPASVDPNAAKITFDYDASNPANLTVIPGNPNIYFPAGGYLRIWDANGQTSRSPFDVSANGDFVNADEAYRASALGFGAGGTSVTFWVEGVGASQSLGDQQIEVSVDPTGTGAGVATDAVRLTVVSVTLQRIQFTGNVNISINGTQDIGSVGDGTTGDVQWAAGIRSQPNSPNQPWDPTQSAPAAFVKGAPLQATVTFLVMPMALTAIGIRALNQPTATGPTGAYGNILPTYLTVVNGVATGTVTTDPNSSDNNVDANTLTFWWQLQSVITSPSGAGVVLPANIKKTQSRIYTLFAQPPTSSPMSEPWATVLELTTGIVKAAGAPLGAASGDDGLIVAQLTRGIYNSLWQGFASSALFLEKPTATLAYDPAAEFALTSNTVTNSNGQILAVAEQYDLSAFMSILSQGGIIAQQCNDNANLLTIFAESLGVDVSPYYLTSTIPGDSLDPIPYLGAGDKITTTNERFAFHQIVIYNGKVYDPSTGPVTGGMPTISTSLSSYMSLVFPGQTYTSVVVSPLTVKPPPPP